MLRSQFPENARGWYVQRDATAKITGCFRNVQQGVPEDFLIEADPEIVAFFNPPPQSAAELEAACATYLNGGGQAVDLRKVLKAIVINFTARALGVAPGALTPAQLQTEHNRIAAIFKQL